MADELDVLVIGAGLAGLRCARELQAAGRDVQVWEASDDVGGRIRTDEVDGFLVDRGFQVLNPAYPAVRRWVDLPALEMRPLAAGVGVRTDDGFAVLANPLRSPALLAATLRSGLLQRGELSAVARWAAPALGSPTRLKRRADQRLGAALDQAGVVGDLRRVIDGFLGGVLLDDSGSTSNVFALLLLRMFALGSPGVPASGMRQLPRQLAATLTHPVRTGTRVRRVDPRSGHVDVQADGLTAHARQVVVATDPRAAGVLTGVPVPPMKGVLTCWFATPDGVAEMLPHPDLLCVDGRTRPSGPLVNVAMMSAAAPSYAPVRRQLVQASALIGGGRVTPGDDAMRQHAGDVLGCGTWGWELVARHEILDALPSQPPPIRLRQPLEIAPGLLVCGDHRDTASIQGALVSGHRAARHILGGPVA